MEVKEETIVNVAGKRKAVVRFLAGSAMGLAVTSAVISLAADGGKPVGGTRAGAYSYSIPMDTVIGIEQRYTLRNKESLPEAARRFGLGYGEIVKANPGLDPWVPGDGTEIKIPTEWILPRAKDEGIVINLAEMRLYYYLKTRNGNLVTTFPIGVGREGYDSPLGVFSVTGKIENPTWYPPPSARDEESGLPAAVSPGPDNPLGEFWLRLSIPGYGLHGTNHPWGVGRRVSRGCIRLYPEDIAWLAASVRDGTRVEIVDQPVKIGRRNGRVFAQVAHASPESDAIYREAVSILHAGGEDRDIDEETLRRTVLSADGIPTVISK